MLKGFQIFDLYVLKHSSTEMQQQLSATIFPIYMHLTKRTIH